jgi:hypothetical protein
MPLVVRLALAGLLALGLVPGIPGFDLLLAAISGREATASAAAARGHPELPESRPWAEASTTDLIAALAVWSPVRSPSRTAWPFKSHDGQPLTTPPGLTVAPAATPPAALVQP